MFYCHVTGGYHNQLAVNQGMTFLIWLGFTLRFLRISGTVLCVFLMRGLSMVKHHGEIVVKHYCLVGSEMLLVSIPTNGVVVHHYPR